MKYSIPISKNTDRFDLYFAITKPRDTITIKSQPETFDWRLNLNTQKQTIPITDAYDTHDLHLAIEIYMYPHMDWDNLRLAAMDDETLFDLSYKLL